jgi:translation initiation factor IF-3
MIRDKNPRQEGARVNQEIKASKVRLIDKDGEMIGVVSLKEALAQAAQDGLDLVEIAAQSDPPVCKILNHGKHKYEQQKKKNEAKKKQKVVELKEVQMRPNIDQNDFDVKCRAIQRFLDDGDKVRVVIRFRGRELSHQEIGMGVLNRVRDLFELCSKVENNPALEGRNITMLLSPK